MAVLSHHNDYEAKLMPREPKIGTLQPVVLVVAGVFGSIALALVVGTILMVTRLGWNLRLISLIGAPVGIACYRFLLRPPRPTGTWRESLPALLAVIALICTALNLIFGVSAVYAVFTLSAAAGLTGMAYLRFLAQLRVMRFVINLVEEVDEENNSRSD
jgi:hypothetical protein